MLSGVNSKENLKEVEIVVIKNLSVSQTLYYHFGIEPLQVALKESNGCCIVANFQNDIIYYQSSDKDKISASSEMDTIALLQTVHEKHSNDLDIMVTLNK